MLAKAPETFRRRTERPYGLSGRYAVLTVFSELPRRSFNLKGIFGGSEAKPAQQESDDGGDSP